MTRITDVNHFFDISEPKFDQALNKQNLIHALNWYSRNKTYKDSQKYIIDFFKKKYKMSILESHTKNVPSNFGFICRIVSNGGSLSQKDQIWFEEQIDVIKNSSKKKTSTTTTNTTTVVNNNPQERIAEKSSEIIAEIEGFFDDMVCSKFKDIPSVVGTLKDFDTKAIHARKVIDWCKSQRIMYDYVLNTKDAYIKEAWSNFSKTNLKKIISFFDQIILDCQNIIGEAVKTRKPRKRKVKTVDQIVSKVKICEEFPELNLKSIDIKNVLGCNQLWVYNVKYRKVGCYTANDASGLSIKGTSIQNFNEDKSIQKKLRKPEESLKTVLSGGKVALRNFLGNIRAVESPLSGRLNEETIILRAVK
jgi:hypothetical protein